MNLNISCGINILPEFLFHIQLINVKHQLSVSYVTNTALYIFLTEFIHFLFDLYYLFWNKADNLCSVKPHSHIQSFTPWFTPV